MYVLCVIAQRVTHRGQKNTSAPLALEDTRHTLLEVFPGRSRHVQDAGDCVSEALA